MATDARLLSLWLPFCRHLQSTVRADQPVWAGGEPVMPAESAAPALRPQSAAADSSPGAGNSPRIAAVASTLRALR